MKTIHSLVDDIYEFFRSGKRVPEEEVEKLGQSLTEMLKRRLSFSPPPRGLSMSSMGSPCKRKLWFQINKPERAEPLEPKTYLNFLAGDIWDVLMPYIARWSGHQVDGEQDTLEVHGVKGHRDCVIDGVTVDVKSANSRSIEKFRKHQLNYDDPFGYLSQLDYYMEGGKDDPKVVVKKQGAFLAIDKERGGLVLDIYPKRDRDFRGEVEEVREMLDSPVPPPRSYSDVPDGKSGNRVIPTPECTYCPFKETCWADANEGAGLLKYIFSSGPRWFTKIVREPNPKVSQD